MIGGVASGLSGVFTPVRSQKTGGKGELRADAANAESGGAGGGTGGGTKALTPDQQQQVVDLKKRDVEVRQHEAAHQAAGGANAGGASFTYQRGPDGKNYAIGGEVQVDVSAASSPQATVSKMEQIKAAALAPAQPSPQDQRVASMADGIKAQAQQEARQGEKKNGGADQANGEQGSGAQGAQAPTAASSPQDGGAGDPIPGAAFRRVSGAYAAAANIGRANGGGGLLAVSA